VAEAMLASKAVTTLVAAGLAVMAIAVFISVLTYRSQRVALVRLVELALEGQQHEARIRARKSGRAVAPLLAVLSGEPVPPPSRSVLGDVSLATICFLPAMALPIYGAAAIEPGQGPDVLALASALMLGLVLMLPISSACAVLVIHLGAETSRAVRSACVKLLAERAREVVSAELKSTLPPPAAPASAATVREDR
jgi:hypothetical protein